MSSRHRPSPIASSPATPRAAVLSYNVATLLRSAPGTERRYTIEPTQLPMYDDLQLAAPIAGEVRLSRTGRSILARASLSTAIEGSCSRCLKAVVSPLSLEIEEEALPSIDIDTGQPVDESQEPDALRLDDHHELDLGEPIREAISLAEPIALGAQGSGRRLDVAGSRPRRLGVACQPRASGANDGQAGVEQRLGVHQLRNRATVGQDQQRRTAGHGDDAGDQCRGWRAGGCQPVAVEPRAVGDAHDLTSHVPTLLSPDPSPTDSVPIRRDRHLHRFGADSARPPSPAIWGGSAAESVTDPPQICR